MSFQTAIFISFGLGSALALTACGNSSAGTGTGGAGGVIGGGGAIGAGGSAGGAPADCATVDYESYKAAGDMISFRKDVLPIVGFACTATSCHNPDTHKAGLNLGWHCNYDTAAKWTCTFPAAPDPSSSTTRPDDDATIAAVYASLMAPSTTVNGGTVKRVAPGDPANSFFILKLADQQSSKGFACTNQDPSTSTSACGVSMPLNDKPYCQGSARPRFDALAAWIAKGAQNN